MRHDSTNNIYVIPQPHSLTFGAAALLSAACCIPAILSLVFMWNKIMEINWKMQFGDRDEEKPDDEPIEGTNGATPEKMQGVNSLIRLFLSAIEVPVFGAAVLAILIIGELNFWSPQLSYQTEPMASVGQWAPIVGTGLAVLGSLYLLLSGKTDEIVEVAKSSASIHHCNCSRTDHRLSLQATPSHHSVTTPPIEKRHTEHKETSLELAPSTTHGTTGPSQDAGNRVKVANALAAIGNYIGTPSQDRFDDSEFKHGKAVDWPEIPGEEQRNSALTQIREQYNSFREDGSTTPVIGERPSRPGSFVGSTIERTTSRTASPARLRSQSPHPPSLTTFQLSHSSTLPVGRTSTELQNTVPASSVGSNPRRQSRRRDTLQVPGSSSYLHTRNNPPTSSVPTVVTTPDGPSSPTIVVSSDPEMAYEPVFDPHTPP